MFRRLVCKLFMLVLLYETIDGQVNITNKPGIQEKDHSPVYLHEVECKAHQYVLATDTIHHKYTPYYVNLFRCQGADNTHAPTHKSCQPIQSRIEEIEIIVYQGGIKNIITVFNHTDCEYRCKENSSSCSKYQTWNEDTCNCDCDLSTKNECTGPKVWESSRCCTCSHTDKMTCENRGMLIDTESCQCQVKSRPSIVACDGSFISGKYFAVIVALEFIAVLFLAWLIFFCCCRIREDHQKVSPIYKIDFMKRGICNSLDTNTSSPKSQMLDDV